MLTSSMVLLLASAAFITYEGIALRNSAVENLNTLAHVIADNSAAPLAFSNADDAREVLATLKAEPHIRAAALYNVDGKLFAAFPDSIQADALPSRPGPYGAQFSHLHLLLFRPVEQSGSRMGSVYFDSDLGAIFARLQLYAVSALLIMAGALFMAFFFSNIIQRRISGPILALAETARVVSEKGDYSVRATKTTEGEPGLLTDAFNRMLDEIQSRQSALRESEERFRALANSIPQLAWTARPDGYIYWYNQRWYQYTGTTPQEMEGWGWQKVHDPTHLPLILEKWNASLGSGSPFEMELPLRGADGVFRPFLIRAVALKDADAKIIQWFGTNTEITEIVEAREALSRSRQELERLVQARTSDLATANQELEAFGYTVSHDLRAPLRHIDSYINLLAKQAGPSLDEKAQKQVSTIAQAAKRMGSLIDDLLVLSRLSRATMVEREVNLRELVDESRKELAPDMAGRNIEWRVGVLPTVVGDPALLRSAVVNLTSNALKYTRGKDPAIIEIGSREEGKEVVCFVKDNGAGFDMRFVEKLFGVFQRLHSAQEFEGTGIGLASVRRVVQRHGGRTWAEGQVGQGATFYFSLPLTRVVRNV